MNNVDKSQMLSTKEWIKRFGFVWWITHTKAWRVTRKVSWTIVFLLCAVMPTLVFLWLTTMGLSNDIIFYACIVLALVQVVFVVLAISISAEIVSK